MVNLVKNIIFCVLHLRYGEYFRFCANYTHKKLFAPHAQKFEKKMCAKILRKKWSFRGNPTFEEKPQMKKNNLKRQKLWYLDQKRLSRCKSGIVIFDWRFFWNYAYSPFKRNININMKVSWNRFDETWLNCKDIVQPLLFNLNWLEVVQLCLRG